MYVCRVLGCWLLLSVMILLTVVCVVIVLCVALAGSARCLCTEELNPDDLEAFTAARLIPLDKKTGVRPIAVGEIHCRIICCAVMRILEQDVILATAPLQLCVGAPSACECAVHAMRRM